ncbi:NAD(P)H-quinone oxidoreductase [Halomonas binhaiensis]|uniref:NAD(P)H-quinone oxidoreductase n=1 Tax=Halomonas binhaiensis TaxID=2562282 RepID=A0A5C1NH96_9GAMM|nr:NAD(P)H-quinone oxidoreductase [Halomonas binhaiensis]QEM82604.1 NAD(P)H-quinone oxidoreductase [Halomonas binhaiensis]
MSSNSNQMTVIEITEPGGPEVLKPLVMAIPAPGPGEILVRVEAAGVNRPDVIQRQGHYPMPEGVTPIPGLEVAGTVASLGEGVGGFQVGDRVCALTNGGGYGEYCVVPESQTLPVPAGMSMIEAAALPETFFTVWANLFDLGGATSGQSALIHGGTSGIGTTALMLCREFGIHAYATAGSDEKCDVISDLGGTPINYRETDFADFILNQTDGCGVDVILDIMGASYFSANMRSLGMDGRLVIIGFLGGIRAEKLDLQELALKRAVITGSTMRARTSTEKAKIANELLEHVWPVLEAGRCHPMIHSTFPLQDVARAHEMMESSKHIGKIVLTLD